MASDFEKISSSDDYKLHHAQNYIIDLDLHYMQCVHRRIFEIFYVEYKYILLVTVKIQLTAKLSTSRTPKKYTNVHKSVAMNAVTTTNRNQCVDTI